MRRRTRLRAVRVRVNARPSRASTSSAVNGKRQSKDSEPLEYHALSGRQRIMVRPFYLAAGSMPHFTRRINWPIQTVFFD